MTSVKASGGTPFAAGSQTLGRGLAALQIVAATPAGMTAQQVADHVGVHRTVAYRLLATLALSRYLVKGDDGRYRPGAMLAVLGASFDDNLRQLSVPTLRALAENVGTTVALLVAEGDHKVAIAVVVPSLGIPRLPFHEGSRRPLEGGAAGVALMAALPPRPDEWEMVRLAPKRGSVLAGGEIGSCAWELAVPVPRRSPSPPTCITLAAQREEALLESRAAVIEAAERLSAILA